MAPPLKEKIACECRQCGKTRMLPPYKARRFKYCNNKCKIKARKKKPAKNKLKLHQLIFIKCKNPLCNHGRFLRPSDFRLNRGKFCSKKCQVYVRTNKFKERMEQLEQIRQQEIKRNLWFFK